MYGREGDLAKLNAARNNPSLSRFQRRQADESHKAIVEQLKDKKLMGMRERLIRAARAGDDYESDKIQRQMRAYQGQDQETGLL